MPCCFARKMLSKYKYELLSRGELYLRVKVRPGAKVTQIKQVLSTADGEILKIDIAAVPERGRANKALQSFLAREFSIRESGVILLSGAASVDKLFKITR